MLDSTDKKVIVHGIPGEGARARGVCKAVAPLLACVFLFGLLCGIILPVDAGAPVIFGLAGVFILVLWLAYDFYSGVSSYFKGARGEEIVAVWLAAGLPGGYHVFHDIEKAGNVPIDHLVIGPAGIFVIETKFWSGKVICREGVLLVDGEKPTRSPVEQVNVECRALTAFLARMAGDVPAVTPVVCFASGTFEELNDAGGAEIEGALICNVEKLADLILAGEAGISPVEVERLVKLLEY